MSKKTPPIWISIFTAGVIAGMITGVGIKIGIEPDDLSVRLYVLEQLCEIQNDDSLKKSCPLIPIFGGILSVVLAIVSAITEANRIQSWKAGLIIYGIGWILGMVWILSN